MGRYGEIWGARRAAQLAAFHRTHAPFHCARGVFTRCSKCTARGLVRTLSAPRTHTPGAGECSVRVALPRGVRPITREPLLPEESWRKTAAKFTGAKLVNARGQTRRTGGGSRRSARRGR